MASDDKILDELHFLSWKIDALEKKLETSLAIQEDLAASLLLEDSSSMSTASGLAIKKFDRRHISGSSCSEPISSDDEQNSPRFNGTRSKDLQQEQERTYLIIPVGSYKDKDSFSYSAEKQTFTWSEMDDNSCKYISSEDVLNSDKEIVNNLDTNERHTNMPSNSNTPKSIANQATPLSQSKFAASEDQMCTQWNGNDCEIIHLEDCLLNSRASHSVDCDHLEGQGEVDGAFDIDYDQDDKMVSTETKRNTSFSNFKYGFTIGIATAKGSSQGIMFNDINSLQKLNTRHDFKPADQHLEHSEKFTTHFETDGFKAQRPAGAQLGPLLKESEAQSMYSSDELTFDQICNHSSNSVDCDSRLTEYKQTFSGFAPDAKTYSTEKGNKLPYKVIYADSESSEDDQTNYESVDACVQDAFSCDKNTGSLNANLGVQSSLANTTPDSKQVSLDYPLLVKNGKYEHNVYSTKKMPDSLPKGNHRFKQMGTDCDAANKRLIEMQIHRSPEEQRYEDAYCNKKRFDAENSLAHNGTGQVEVKQRETQTHDITAKVNSNGETSMTALYRANGTKLPLQEVDGQSSHFDDRVYGIVGIDNNYEAINTDTIDTARSKTTPDHPCREKTNQNPDVATRTQGPHTNSAKDGFPTSHRRSQNFLNERALYNGTQSEFRFDGDALTESGFSETAMSTLSDDAFLAVTPNLDSGIKTLSNTASPVDHTAKFETSESESLFSSLTSVSSNNEVIHPWTDSVSRHYGNDDKKHVISPTGGDALRERNHQRTSASLYIGDNDSSTDSETPLCGFRLSPLPRPARAPSLHEHLLSDVIVRDYSAWPMRISSPTSSVDTSELSVSDSFCECQYQCECQTGIPSPEDFREELKAISTYVLNARKESASSYKKPRASYFLDEEQGDMEIFDERLQKKANKAVPILVRVILRLRKHFFGNLESKPPYNSKTRGDLNNNDFYSLDQSDEQTSNGKRRDRKISFSPSAVLLSAIGENSAAEIKEVIEKENIDVNQLSPSGRSLLHKAAAAGDLESIYTLIQYGAFVNIHDQDGFPPIHSALRKAHFKCAVLLIECGTDMVRYTTERVREFLEIQHMTSRHLPVPPKNELVI